MEPEPLPFIVEIWKADECAVERIVSRNAVVSVARGAFERAARMYPDRVIMLRDRARILERCPRD